MNILILNWRGIKHPLAGGAEFALFEHAKKWKSKGTNVTWFTSSYKGASKEEVVEGIRFIRVGSQKTVHIWAFIYYILGRFGKTDIVVDSFHFIPFFTPLYFFGSQKIALINEVAGRLWFSNIFFPASLIGYLVERASFVLYGNTIFITASKSTEQELVKKGIVKKNIHIVLNGVTLVKTRKNISKNKVPTMLFLGRISEDKGIKDALDVFEKIHESIPSMKFWIAGKEEKPGMIKNLKSNHLSLRARKKVTYLGFISQKEKFELFKKSWLLVHPSMKEGWGLTVIEAASCGIPTVGYDVEGLRDSIVDGKTGILTETNSDALAEGVMKVLNNNKLRNNLGKNAFKWSQKFSWENSTRESWKVVSLVK